MEKGNNHYEYIKTLINLYTDLDCYSYGIYSESAICIIEENGNYIVAIGEKGTYHLKKEVETPTAAAYAALKISGIDYRTNDYEKIRDKFLENNIDYVEALLNDKNFLEMATEITKHFDYENLKIMALFSIIELGFIKNEPKVYDNKMQFIIAALLVKKPKDKVIRK